MLQRPDVTRITERENRTGPASATLGGPEAATLCILSAHGPLVARIASLVPGLTVIGIVPDSLALETLGLRWRGPAQNLCFALCCFVWVDSE